MQPVLRHLVARQPEVSCGTCLCEHHLLLGSREPTGAAGTCARRPACSRARFSCGARAVGPLELRQDQLWVCAAGGSRAANSGGVTLSTGTVLGTILPARRAALMLWASASLLAVLFSPCCSAQSSARGWRCQVMDTRPSLVVKSK